MSRRSEEMDIEKLQQNARDHLEKAFLEQGKAFSRSEGENNDLKKKIEQNEAQLKDLQKKLEDSEVREKELEKAKDTALDLYLKTAKKLDQSESQKTELENTKEAQKKDLEQHKIKLKRMQERIDLEQRKANENLLKQKKENEELRKKITELEDLKDEAEEVSESSEDDKPESDEGESEDEKSDEMGEVRKKLTEKEEELADVEALNNTLIVKELKSNTELQEARAELIRGWESTSCAFIGIKKMGELDSTPFQNACKRKYKTEEADDQAAELCSLWEDYIRDSSWHPFKTCTDSFGDCKVIIDKDDNKLKKLKNQFGVEVHQAVSTALMELNEYNSSGRYPVKDLWNFKQNRRASLKEGILYVLKQLKLQKRRRTY